jgi:hypothetical protein
MTSTFFARRIAKLEIKRVASHPSRRVERHIISDKNETARQARMAAIVDAGHSNVLHIFRVIVSPAEKNAA